MSSTEVSTPSSAAAAGADLRTRVARAQRLSTRFAVPQIIGVLVLFFVGSALIDGYAGTDSIKSQLVIASFLGLAAGGEAVAVLLGGIDLSVPAMITLGDVAVPQLTNAGWPFWQALLLILALAALAGLTNGLISKRFEIHPLIVTLGMSAVIAGGLLVWTKGQPAGAAPAWLDTFVSPATTTGPIPLPPVVMLWAVVTILAITALTRTPAGRRLFATAANERAAVLAQVRTTRVWAGAFVVSAILAAVSGITLAGFSSQGDLTIGSPYLFTTVAAVVVGGTSLRGARGGFGRVVFGAMILTEIETILVGEGLSDAAQQTALGVIILLVVAATGRERPLRERI